MPYTPRYTESEDPDEVRKRMYLTGDDSPMDAPPFSPPDVQQAQQSAAILPVPAPKPTPMPPPPTDSTGPAAQLQQAPPQPVPTGKEDPGAAQSMKQPPPPPPAAMGGPAAPRAIDQLASLKAPEPTKPKWYQRLAAVGVGGAAGWVNAAGRTKVDPSAAIGEIMQPGYAAKTAAYQRKKADLGERAGYEQDQQKLDDAKEAKANKIKQDQAKLAEKAEADATAATAKAEAEKRKRFEDATGFVAKGGKILKIGEPVPNGYTPLPVNPSDPDSVYALPETKTHFQVGAKFRKSAEDAGVVLDDSTQLLSSDDFGKISGLIAKHIENDAKPAPNVTEAQMAMDSANPDPSISGPAKAALKNLAETKQNSTRIHISTNGANDADTIAYEAQDLAEGKRTIRDFPASHRGPITKYMHDNRLEVPTPMTEPAKNVVAQTDGVITQIDRLLAKLEPEKNNDRPLAYTMDRAKYSMGMAGTEGGDIADLSLSGIVGAARILKGTSRAKTIFEKAQEHTPSPWVDSKKMIYEKLTRMKQNLMDGRQAVLEEGKKFGSVENAQRMGSGGSKANAKPTGGAKTGPPVGTVIDGHKFNGGDPNDQRNWSTVK